MAKMLRTSPEGRKCLFPHCTQTLSIYNHEAYCHLHRDRMAPKQKTKMFKGVVPTAGLRTVL